MAADWRELGEVPDSEDDDGFDSMPVTGSEPNAPPKSPVGGPATLNDIWDIPSSQEEEAPGHLLQRPLPQPQPKLHAAPPPSDPSSSPLSSIPSSQEIPSIEDLYRDLENYPPRSRSTTPRAVPPASPRVISSSPEPKNVGREPWTEFSPTPLIGRTPIQSQILGYDAELQEARRAAVQYERSLRSRRPEQMRPYFTERNRFNNEWRQHGLRPLRFANEGDQAQHHRESSTERDFEPPTQESSAQQPTDESQQTGPVELLEPPLFPESSSPLHTSPVNNQGGPSSQPQADTDSTSLEGDDLPSLQDLAKRRHQSSALRRTSKRKRSPVKAVSAKRRRMSAFVDDGGSPEQRQTFIRPPGSSDSLNVSDVLDQGAGPVGSPSPRRITAGPQHRKANRNPTALRETGSITPAPLVIESDSGQDTERPGPAMYNGSDAEDFGSSSDSGSDIVNQNSRRIRGVLPASWLRLDQLPGHGKIQKRINRRRSGHTPERDHRRGVAQRRRADPGTSNDRVFFEESEDDGHVRQLPPTTDETFSHQTTLSLLRAADDRTDEALISDDDASVMEEDHIDPMISGRKRQTKLADAFKRANNRPKTGPSAKVPFKRVGSQPKITGAFAHSRTAGSATKTVPRPQTKSSRKRSGPTSAKRPKAPQISVLDVIEPGAPRFLKIAARTARGRRDQGRSSPGRKRIQLATRSDHVDAASVLNNWKDGSIRQRHSVTAARKASKAKKPRAQPLHETSSNSPRPTPRASRTPRSTGPKVIQALNLETLKRQPGVSHKTQAARDENADQAHPRLRNVGLEPRYSARPAQLEMDHGEEMSTASFHAGKKLLDRLYRSKQRTSAAASSALSHHDTAHSTPRPSSLRRSASLPSVQPPANPPRRPRGPRPARKSKPRRIDVEAPQYTHANDPLPAQHSPSAASDPMPARLDGEVSRLQGLGHYGTHYTHHFEIFPLEVGVYFHDSTLIGSGVVERVLHEHPCLGAEGAPKPRVSLALGEQTLRWGPWSAQVSSEMGVVLDYIADQLERDLPPEEAPNTPSAMASADHILFYVKNSLTFDTQPDCRAYMARFVEAVQSFNNRALSHINEQGSAGVSQSFLGTYERLTLAACWTMKICRTDPAMVGERLQMEEVLKSVVRTLIKSLSQAGLHQLRDVYNQLRGTAFRERGLRADAPEIHSWVLVLRVLEYAAIPRASFWDLVQLEAFDPGFGSSVNAQDHERLWENTFTLLPLVEFNDMGVLVAGRRYRQSTDGWAGPQKILRRLFQLYRENPRQPPSFNSYCRAVVARCHYLVKQWGWRRCSSVVGLIFDFFGSQNLAHLRNEEAYSSPAFLEDLAGNPSLDIQPEDRCFHIFLKLVALSISKLREDGSTKDIRNLVARTVPNHNRQHLREQKVHARDLAALRNHHDLLCTLYWAAPPDLRPSVGLLERLVAPASSHKEACLINMRAWGQLARYVAASGQAATCFMPFNQWRNTFFQQVMHQFDSVGSDIEQQFLRLSKDATKSISQDMISAMTLLNKTAVMDVLHFSVSASLDVMKHAHDLEAATFALSSLQLQRVFRHFSAVPPELDWAILRASLSTLDAFLTQVDKFKESEESQQSESQILDSAQADDALLVLYQDVAGSYFSMARRLLSPRSSRDTSPTVAADRAGCVEQTVVLGARIGLRFSNAGVMELSDMFKPGKHCLYPDPPHLLGLEERRHLVLFVTTLLRYGLGGLEDVGFTLHELWMLSIVKPRVSLSFEIELAEQLVHHGKDFVPDAVVGIATSPDYGMNRDLFEFAMSSMRKSVRDAPPGLKKSVVSEYSRTLKLVMDQIRSDLGKVSQDAVEHASYVSFARDIISLIRAHGSDICAVDDFFYQISKDYSPSVQDPQLQVAGMISYGLRLGEGDSRVAHQLFFFLFNNFKIAMMNDTMSEEIAMLEQGLRNPGIFRFLVGSMLPAAIRSSTVDLAASALVDVYAQALYLFLEHDEAPPELGPSCLGDLALTLGAMADSLNELGHEEALTDLEIHQIRQFLGLMNIFWPSLHVLNLYGTSSSAWDEVKSLLKDCRAFSSWAETYLKMHMEMPDDHDDVDAVRGSLSTGLQRVAAGPRRTTSLITGFTENIVNDVRRSWIVSDDRLSIQAPGKPQGTQSTRGIERPTFDGEDLLADVLERARTWNRWWEMIFGVSPDRHGRTTMAAPVI